MFKDEGLGPGGIWGQMGTFWDSGLGLRANCSGLGA